MLCSGMPVISIRAHGGRSLCAACHGLTLGLQCHCPWSSYLEWTFVQSAAREHTGCQRPAPGCHCLTSSAWWFRFAAPKQYCIAAPKQYCILTHFY